MDTLLALYDTRKEGMPMLMLSRDPRALALWATPDAQAGEWVKEEGPLWHRLPLIIAPARLLGVRDMEEVSPEILKRLHVPGFEDGVNEETEPVEDVPVEEEPVEDVDPGAAFLYSQQLGMDGT